MNEDYTGVRRIRPTHRYDGDSERTDKPPVPIGIVRRVS